MVFCFRCLFLFFESRMLLINFVATPLYLYFAVLLCQGKVANAKLLLTFVAVGNRMFFVTVLGIKKSKKLQMMLRFFVLFLYDVTNFHYFYVFSSERRKCLEKNRHYGLFWSDRFCLFFVFSLLQVFKLILFVKKWPLEPSNSS